MVLVACSRSPRREAAAPPAPYPGAYPTGEILTPGPDSATPGGAPPLPAGPLTLSTGAATTALYWSPEGIVLASDDGITQLTALSAQAVPQMLATPPSQPAGANPPALLTGASAAPTLAWVSGETTVVTFNPGRAPIQAGSAAPVTGLAVSPDGSRTAYATYDGKLTVQANTPGAQSLQAFDAPGWLSSLAFSPDGSRLAGADLPNFALYVFDAASGGLQHTLEWVDSPTPALYAALISPDWRNVAWVAGSAVQLMDVAGGEAGPLLNHEDAVAAAAWSPDGDRLATAAAATLGDNFLPAALIWDPLTGDLFEAFPQSAPVLALSFSPDGRQLAVLDAAGRLQISTLSP